MTSHENTEFGKENRRAFLEGIGFGVPGASIAGFPSHLEGRTKTDRTGAQQAREPYEGGVSVVAATETDAFFVIELGARDDYYEYNFVGPVTFTTNGTIVHASSLTERNQFLETVLEVSFIAAGTATRVPVSALWNLGTWLGENDPEGTHGLQLQVAPGYDPIELLVWVTGSDPAENVRAYYDVQNVAGETLRRMPFYVPNPRRDGKVDGDEDTLDQSLVQATICGEIENEWHRSGLEHSHSHRCLDSRNQFSIATEPTVYFWVEMRNVPPASYRFDWNDPDGEHLGSSMNEVPPPDDGSVFPERHFWAWMEFDSSTDPGTYGVTFSFDESEVVSREFVLE